MKRTNGTVSVRRCAVVVLLCCAASAVYGQSAAADGEGTVFRYRFAAGESYRIVSEVYQEVYQNGHFLYSANQLNRILVEIDRVEPVPGAELPDRPWDAPEDMLRAFHRLTYQHSVETESPDAVHQWDREYGAEFWRDEQGFFDIGTQYFVPTVQNVPVFPGGPLLPGTTWSADGIEVHDLTDGFGLEEPFRFSMPVSYRYEGEAEWEGEVYEAVSIEYRVYFPTGLPSVPPTNPRLVTGTSSQLLYWDSDLGRPAYYTEEYELSLILASGALYTFTGTASARVVDSERLDRGESIRTIEEQIDELGLEDVGVRETDEGVSIVLEDIRFPPDSAFLADSEREKLRRIALILDLFPEHDILVTGHTALAGTEEGRRLLSEERARAVGQYLLDIGARERYQIMYQGLGADDPVAGNDTEEGRRQNRRVEILILDH